MQSLSKISFVSRPGGRVSIMRGAKKFVRGADFSTEFLRLNKVPTEVLPIGGTHLYILVLFEKTEK